MPKRTSRSPKRNSRSPKRNSRGRGGYSMTTQKQVRDDGPSMPATFDKYRNRCCRDPDRGSPLDQWGAAHAWRLGTYWTVPVEVPLQDLAHIQAVVQSKARLADIRRARERDVPLPPIEVSVFRDGSAWLVDGNHRLADARRAHLPSIPVTFTFVGA